MVLRLPDSWSNRNLKTLEERGKPSTWRKTSRRKGENQQQTQPIYGVDEGTPFPWVPARSKLTPIFSHPKNIHSDWVRLWIHIVFKNFHSGERIQKVAGSHSGYTESTKEKLRIQKDPDTRGRGLKLQFEEICVTWKRFFCQNSVIKKCFESSIAQARACLRGVFRPIKFNFRSWRQLDLSLFYLPRQSNFPCSLLGLVANLWANQSVLNPKLKEKGCPSAPWKVSVSDQICQRFGARWFDSRMFWLSYSFLLKQFW